jgi:hypothetical protein
MGNQRLMSRSTDERPPLLPGMENHILGTFTSRIGSNSGRFRACSLAFRTVLQAHLH